MKYLAWCLALKKSFDPIYFDDQFPDFVKQMEIPLSSTIDGLSVKEHLASYALPKFYSNLSSCKSMGLEFARTFRLASTINGIADFEPK